MTRLTINVICIISIITGLFLIFPVQCSKVEILEYKTIANSVTTKVRHLKSGQKEWLNHEVGTAVGDTSYILFGGLIAATFTKVNKE